MEDERTLKLKKNYVHHFFADGMAPRAIFRMYGVSYTTGYKVKDELEKELSLPRGSLLERPHSAHIMGARNYEPVRSVDVSVFEKRVKEMEKEMANIKAEFKQVLELHERLVDEL